MRNLQQKSSEELLEDLINYLKEQELWEIASKAQDIQYRVLKENFNEVVEDR